MDKKNFSYDGIDYVVHMAKRPYLEYYAQYKISTIKLRKRVYSGFAHCETLDEMHRAAIRYLQRGANVEMRDFLDEYIAICKSTLKPKTVVTYNGMIDRFRTWCRAHRINLKRVSMQEAQFYTDYLYSENLHNNTVAHNINVLRIAYNKMLMRKVVKANPFQDIKTRKKAPQPLQFFTDRHIKLIKGWCLEFDAQLWLACELQFSCFIRPKEMRLLRVHDFNLDEGIIDIRATVSKNGKAQCVIIPDHLLPTWRARLAGCNGNQYVFTISGMPGDQMAGRDYLSKHHKKCLTALGIEGNFGFYSWKHTGVIKAVRNGINIRDIQNQLRHHSLDMVQRYLANLGAIDSDELRHNMPRI
jgi:site-specific recombinase XerD